MTARNMVFRSGDVHMTATLLEVVSGQGIKYDGVEDYIKLTLTLPT